MNDIGRRSFLRGSALIVGAAAVSPLLNACGGRGQSSRGGLTADLQAGWLISEGLLGEAVGLAKGWYADEGIDLGITPGGPSIDGVALVGSGKKQIGQVPSSPSLMLAVAQGVPVKAFAVGVQRQPYAYVSRPGKAVKEPRDLIGKTVGTQATGQILIDALLKVNKIDPKDVKIEVIGAEITPLTTGQVDVWTGWLTNTAALRPLNNEYETMTLWDAGVELYGFPYYAQTTTIEENPELLRKFVAITAKAWEYAIENLDEASEAVVRLAPAVKASDIKSAAETIIPYAFNAETASNGWGAMSGAVWQKQIDLYSGLGQFKGATPKLDDVIDMSILEATASDRPKMG